MTSLGAGGVTTLGGGGGGERGRMTTVEVRPGLDSGPLPASSAQAVADACAVRVSPPRTGSTPVARMLWQHDAVTHHCHEPFEAGYWGGRGVISVWQNLACPMEVASGSRIPLSRVPPASGLLVKEMTFQLDAGQFLFLAGLATAPVVFVMRDPRLSTASRLRIVRELYGEVSFPPFESGWQSLAEQVRLCERHGIDYVIVDSAEMRANSAGVASALLKALRLPAQPELDSWSPRPGLQLCSPQVGALMSEKRADDDPFYRRVLSSDGIQPADVIDWSRESALIRSAGLADDLAAWTELYEQLRADPNRLRAEP